MSTSLEVPFFILWMPLMLPCGFFFSEKGWHWRFGANHCLKRELSLLRYLWNTSYFSEKFRTRVLDLSYAQVDNSPTSIFSYKPKNYLMLYELCQDTRKNIMFLEFLCEVASPVKSQPECTKDWTKASNSSQRVRQASLICRNLSDAGKLKHAISGIQFSIPTNSGPSTSFVFLVQTPSKQ